MRPTGRDPGHGRRLGAGPPASLRLPAPAAAGAGRITWLPGRHERGSPCLGAGETRSDHEAEPSRARGARLPAATSRGLRDRVRRLQLAPAGPLQLRHGVVRRAGRRESRRTGPLGHRRRLRGHPDVRRAAGQVDPGRAAPPRPWTSPRRPPPARPRQLRPTLGDHARRNPDRCGHHPGHPAALSDGPGRPGQPWQRPAARRARRRRREVCRPRPAAGQDRRR